MILYLINNKIEIFGSFKITLIRKSHLFYILGVAPIPREI
jgi:hypothetical protein